MIAKCHEKIHRQLNDIICSTIFGIKNITYWNTFNFFLFLRIIYSLLSKTNHVKLEAHTTRTFHTFA